MSRSEGRGAVASAGCRRLRVGDLVALVAPAGPVARERVEGAVGLLEGQGLRVWVRDDIASRRGCLAGTDERRLRELREALRHPEVSAVFLARGGYGTQRLLPGLEPEASVPRPLIGFSDNTALLNHIRQRFGWPVLHGPHPQREKPEELREVLSCLGFEDEPLLPRYEGLRTLGGAAGPPRVGEVAGGCLSLLASSVGTPYALEARGKLLFVEDTREPPYRLDRMLQQLRASGALAGVLGVLFGEPDSFGTGGSDGEVDAVLEDFAAGVDVPVLVGLPCGHTSPNRPLPFGPRASLDPGRGTLTFLEALTA